MRRARLRSRDLRRRPARPVSSMFSQLRDGRRRLRTNPRTAAMWRGHPSRRVQSVRRRRSSGAKCVAENRRPAFLIEILRSAASTSGFPGTCDRSGEDKITGRLAAANVVGKRAARMRQRKAPIQLPIDLTRFDEREDAHSRWECGVEQRVDRPPRSTFASAGAHGVGPTRFGAKNGGKNGNPRTIPVIVCVHRAASVAAVQGFGCPGRRVSVPASRISSSFDASSRPRMHGVLPP